MFSHGYEEVEHTADLAVKVRGPNFHSLLMYAAAGLYDLMGCVPKSGSHAVAKFFVSSGDQEGLIVDFLAELLHLCEVQGKLFDEFHFDETEEGLMVKCSGYEIITVERYIKAVTFYDLNILETENGLEATITFDV